MDGLQDKAGAWRLLGIELENGWKIVEPVGWDATTGDAIDHYNGTGGNFSVPYVVEREGQRAFLKAIDLTDAMNAPNIFQKLKEITDAHSFESKILEICAREKMDKVVVALDSGELRLGPNIQDVAPYLIFELADGDVRRRIQKVDADARLAWWLRAMHHAAIGLSQLHSKNIAHQDLKPSNILSFHSKQDFKISDLGRCTCEEHVGPNDPHLFAGDWTYAPPEILYRFFVPDLRHRRLSSDLYLLGSMIFFFTSGFGSTALLINSLSIPHRPPPYGSWTGTFAGILPMLQGSFTSLLDDMRSVLPDGPIATDLLKTASELANPDPSLRGHPLNRGREANRYSLERYVALFDRLSKLAEVDARKSTAR